MDRNQILIDNHIVREGDTIKATLAERWTGDRWVSHGEPETWQVQSITDKMLTLVDPASPCIHLRLTLDNVRLGKLRVIQVEHLAPEPEDLTLSDLYTLQKRLKERLYETTSTTNPEEYRELLGRYKAAVARLDAALDKIKL